ncbi:DUF4437 domain-containing protein [Pelagicoccus sp. SDUM812005]|uniref:DUF4437 domain-containing protein n=1 Tax=Pelagicoccus sp. SDUM812005 TaxID=3041257 RepID=UPI0028102825|nr:DUF4437 domain-containing protein [Pelagicoccus sp. SDUM812005]MDQ8183692.1 DUF4437 domain-containing protein [Pelagicoccus sp. SDUM812005]
MNILVKAKRTSSILLLSLTVFLSQLQGQEVIITQASEVEWTHLNPKRGDLAPKAGTLWGDRNSDQPTGFLLKPSDGFESPPHIHNVSYRGVVISGLIHNDDPEAAEMWMPAGSFWTQPKGEVHITAAQGTNSLAYIEIEEGPYLVHPSEQAFDSGERPVTVDPSNIVWLTPSDLTWISQSKQSRANASAPAIAYLWGSTGPGELNGSFLKLPAGFSGTLSANSANLRAVVVKGQLTHQVNGKTNASQLAPGSYFSSTGQTEHSLTSKTETTLYLRTEGKYRVSADERSD